jgi:glutathione-regulated potassium-efflux system ancillary protein KefG
VLVLFAHPALHRSRANAAMTAALRDVAGVTVHDLYDSYPDFLIDVAREQALLHDHDAIVFQHPFYWYSAPALAKEWLDLVLTHGWAYGDGGTALAGKLWMSAITTGGSESDYAANGANQFSIDDLMRPFEATASLCGMIWQAPFVMHDSRVAGPRALEDSARAYRARILALQRMT